MSMNLQYLANLNNVAVNILTHVFWYIYIYIYFSLLGKIPEDDISGSKTMFIINLVDNVKLFLKVVVPI